MERPAGNIITAPIEQYRGAPQHLLRCLARERKEEDALRVYPALDKIRYAMNKCCCLPRSCPGNYKYRTFYGRHSFVLSGVERILVVDLRLPRRCDLAGGKLFKREFFGSSCQG